MFNGIKPENALKHFLTITEHKIEVMRGCFKIGLFSQGLLHDLSKYTPDEFLVGARYYQGNRSPNNAEREAIGYSTSWLHHKGRNRHHYEYWIDYKSSRELKPGEDIMIPVKMPLKYVLEMMMDRIAASKIYNKGHYRDDYPLKYLVKSYDVIPMHEETKRLLYALLKMLAVYGEDKTFRFIKTRLLRGNKIKRGH